MTAVSCDARRCIHHDGEGCMLDEAEITVEHEGDHVRRAVCDDYAEEVPWRGSCRTAATRP